MKLDLHVHTKYSKDSLSQPRDVMRRMRKLGMIPAITDHNNMDAHAVFRNMGFEFIPGEEVRTVEGDLIGLYLSEPIARKTPFLETLDIIKGQGGLSYLPHMYDNTRHGVSRKELAEKVDIVEVFNPRCVFGWQNEKALKFAKEHGKARGAGGDSHFVMEIGDAYVDAPEVDVSEPKGLLKALANGKVVGKKPRVSLRGATTAVSLAKRIFKF